MSRHHRTTFEITVRGALDAHWEECLLGMTLLESAPKGLTVMVGHLDQSGLHGVLQRLADFGVPLVSVRELPPAEELDPSPSEPTSGRKEKNP